MKRSLLVALIALGFCAAVVSAAQPATKILLIGKDRDHPYRSHEYMAESRLLAKCLEQTPGVRTVVSNGWPKDSATLAGVDAIVLYTANGGDVLFGGPHRAAVKELLADGVGLVAIHWSTGATSQETGQPLLSALGGWFSTDFSRLKVTNTKLRQADPSHVIARGWSDYDLVDEYYLDLKFLTDSQPMITVAIEGEVFPVGWIYQRPGGGRSFGFVCGHFHKNFGIDPFRRSIVNAILWTAHRDFAPEGAPAKIEPADMELPPDEREQN